MASSQDHHTNTEATIKKHFLGLAKMLEKGYPLPIQTNNDKIILCPMPSGWIPGWISGAIQQYTEVFPRRMRIEGSEWKKLRITSSTNKTWVLLYRCEAFPSDGEASSDEEATRSALSPKNLLQQIHYADYELKNGE
jgi:hypothetical protein